MFMTMIITSFICGMAFTLGALLVLLMRPTDTKQTKKLNSYWEEANAFHKREATAMENLVDELRKLRGMYHP